jgi:hypothetical protein
MGAGLERIDRMRRLAAAVAWRGWWKADDTMRGLMWGERLGFELRQEASVGVAVSEPRVTPVGDVALARSAQPIRSRALGVLHGARSGIDGALLAEIGHFYGLEVHRVAASDGGDLIAHAHQAGWPLVALTAGAMRALPESLIGMLKAYVEAGGTLFVDGVAPDTNSASERLSDSIGFRLPSAQRFGTSAAEVVFSAKDASFTQEFAGIALVTSQSQFALTECETAAVHCWLRGDGLSQPAVAEVGIGEGQIVLSVRGPEADTLAEALSPLRPLAALPAMMLVKQVYREMAWRSRGSFASFVIDDPALRNGRLGLDYGHVLGVARENGFHLTVATIPRELGLAEPDVVDLLRTNRRWISACYHGSDHSGYEFYLPQGRRMRYRTRAIPAQERALDRAVERAEAFARRTGLALDRVMVFPHGIGPSQVLRRMQALGFLAACNFDDRYPLGAPVPDDFDLGMRPADLGWEGFPLMWRRGLGDPMFILDLFLGRPALTFGHLKSVGPDLEPFVQRAMEIRRIADVRWTSLEDISRHCYLERYDPRSGWHVSMTSNEICLHNPEASPRSYIVARHHMPEGFELDTDADHYRTERGLEVTVRPGGTCVVRATSFDARWLTPGRPCSVLEAGAQASTA